VILGILLVVLMLVAPGGIVGLWRTTVAKRAAKRAAKQAELARSEGYTAGGAGI